MAPGVRLPVVLEGEAQAVRSTRHRAQLILEDGSDLVEDLPDRDRVLDGLAADLACVLRRGVADAARVLVRRLDDRLRLTRDEIAGARRRCGDVRKRGLPRSGEVVCLRLSQNARAP